MKSSVSQTASEHLLSENAKLQVHITTLQSQTNSLNAQHTALQLANSQLVAEKEEVPRSLTRARNFHLHLSHRAFISSNINRDCSVPLALEGTQRAAARTFRAASRPEHHAVVARTTEQRV